MMLPRSIRKVAATLAALCLSAGCAGNTETGAPEVPANAFWLTEERAFFWAFVPPGEQDVRLYLLGSIHSLDVPLALGPKLERAFSAADVLAMEIDLRSVGEEETTEQIIRYGVLEWRERLEDFVSPDTIAELREYIESGDLSPDDERAMMSLRPWAIATMIEQQANESSGLKREYGVEAYFLARAERMPIVGLETLDEQFYELASHSDALQEEFLIVAIRQAARDETDLAMEAWKQGDTAHLVRYLASDGEAHAEFNESFLYGRNEGMASRLIELLEENPDTVYFTVVGAAHVIGESDIPSLLEAEGFVAVDTSAPLVGPSP